MQNIVVVIILVLIEFFPLHCRVHKSVTSGGYNDRTEALKMSAFAWKRKYGWKV